MSLGPEWAYHITVDREDWEVIQHWCNVNIGKFDHEWYKLGIDPADYIIHGSTRTTWYFKEEKHAVIFKLKWA